MRKITIAVLLLAGSTCPAQERKQVTSCDSVRYYKHKSDSLSVALFLSNYRVEKIKYYLNICNKNPKQDKFLRGWINRSVK